MKNLRKWDAVVIASDIVLINVKLENLTYIKNIKTADQLIFNQYIG